MLTRPFDFWWRGGAKRDSLGCGLFGEGRGANGRRSRFIRRRAAAKKGQRLLDRVVLARTVALRRLGSGEAGEKGFWRFLHNERVSEAALIEAARAQLLPQVRGRRVLAIQDTSEINFSRQKQRKTAFGRGGNGADPAFFIHPVLVADADSDAILGLAGIELWERHGPGTGTESERWLRGAAAAATLHAAGAVAVTVVADREGDIYAAFARRPAAVELLVRAQTERALADGGHLFAHLDGLPIADRFVLELPAIPGRPARRATMVLRYGPVRLRRPRRSRKGSLPEELFLYALDVREVEPPAGVAAVHWRLLSSAPVESIAAAHRAIADYRRRWHIEQLFRTLKRQGLGLEESQIETPAALRKLALVALRAAVICMQLVHARDGADARPASAAFAAGDLELLDAIAPSVDGNTPRLRNPFPPQSLPWAAWIIARLGAWSGAKDARPPGPITMHRGLQAFHDIARGFRLKNVSMR